MEEQNENLKNKDNNNLVVDENKKIVDIYDILNGNSEKLTINKINMLLNFDAGVTIEQIVEKYNEVSGGNVSDINAALDNLEKAYRIIADNVSKAPNGIVINLDTGEKDDFKSAEQAAKYGIDGAENTSQKTSRLDKFFEKELQKDEKSEEKIKVTTEDRFSVKTNFGEAIDKLLYSDQENKFINDIVSNFGKTIENEHFSNQLKEEINETQNNIFSKNAIKMKFKILLAESQEFPDRSKKELNDFMNKYSQYSGEFFQILQEGIDRNEIESYKNDVIKNSFSSIMDKVSQSTEKELMEMTEDDKKAILTRALSIMNTNTSNEYLQEIEKTMQTIYPQIKNVQDFDTMSKILGVQSDKVMETALELADYFSKNDIDKVINWQEQNKDISKINSKEMGEYFIKNKEPLVVDDVTKSPHQIFFNNSKLEFSDFDERSLRIAHATSRTFSWIDSKDNLLEYEFFSLMECKERILEDKSKRISEKQKEADLKKIEKKIQQFEKRHKDFNKEQYLKNGKLNSESKSKIKVFQKAKVKGDMLSNYIEDEETVKSPEDFEKLSKEAKAKYLRDTIYGLPDRQVINKMAMRRLEIISDKNKAFITFDKDNKPQINEKLLIEEGKKYGVINEQNADILSNGTTYITELNKYAVEKLESYEKLPESYFVKLDEVKGGSTLTKCEAMVKQIDQIKLQNKLKRGMKISEDLEQGNEENIRNLQRDEKVMSQEDIDKLFEKMNGSKKELSFKERVSNALSKNNKEFEDEMKDLIYEDPVSSQEILKGIVSDKDSQEMQNFQNKVMFMQESIKLAEKEKLKEAFSKDNEDFKTEVKDLVKLNPSVAQEFLKEFLSNSENLNIKNCNSKVMTLQNVITEELNERGGDKTQTSKFLSAEEIDISNLPKETGISLFSNNEGHKLEDDDEPCL